MKIHEYQAKEILAGYGIPIPRGRLAQTAAQAERAAREMGGRCVIKAQIHAGGRGKGGGVRMVSGPDEAAAIAGKLLGNRLVTPQTGPEGLPVQRLLVEEVIDVERELYLSLTLDRENARYCLIASSEGGMDIEELARTAPDRLLIQTIDPFIGLRPHQARRIALGLGFAGPQSEECVELILNLYRCFLEKDCSLAEINPLVMTGSGWLLAMDAKLSFDDNALFRHQDYAGLVAPSQLNPLEIEAAGFDLSYIKLSGAIGCLVNGAGLAMATMDVLQEAGGEPANFLDVGGGASREKVAAAFRIILRDSDVRGIFVNIFGGIMRCDLIAQGIMDAASGGNCRLPIVVRMEGNQVEEGKRMLRESGLNVGIADSLGAGARDIVALLKGEESLSCRS